MTKSKAKHRKSEEDNILFHAEITEGEKDSYLKLSPWRNEYTANERNCRDIENAVWGRLREKGLIN